MFSKFLLVIAFSKMNDIFMITDYIDTKLFFFRSPIATILVVKCKIKTNQFHKIDRNIPVGNFYSDLYMRHTPHSDSFWDKDTDNIHHSSCDIL